MTSVAILGGGVGGLSAAHELAKRGFEVTVYEARSEFGGKARSIDVPDSAVDGRDPLPGEHGFRFFPGFYKHLDKTMEEIPFYGGSVKDNLVKAREMLMARDGGQNETVGPTAFPLAPDDFWRLMRFVYSIGTQMGIPLSEYVFFLGRLVDYLTSCDQRRLAYFETKGWYDFVMGDTPKSKAYEYYLARGMTRALVAARAEDMSASTGCAILCQLMLDMTRVDGQVDRVLDGPTSDVWIKPWIKHLRGKCGVKFVTDRKVTEIRCETGTITKAVAVSTDAGTHDILADYFISAIPVDNLRHVVEHNDEIKAAEPKLATLDKLETAWMTGAMFYLSVNVPWVAGHVIFLNSPWALTAISQKQFWSELHLENYGDGSVKGILSVDISNWEMKGSNGKTAMECTKEEILDEVWRQMEAHLNDNGPSEFRIDRNHVVTRFLDPGIHFDPETKIAKTNDDALLINKKDTWKYRPYARTKIPNFFIASDFVRTNTDLATMEGANEAARRAVNGILDAVDSKDERCELFDFSEPPWFALFREYDEQQWRKGHRDPREKPPVALDEDGRMSIHHPTTDLVS